MPINDKGQLVVTDASRYALKNHPRGVQHGSTRDSVAREKKNILTRLSRSIRRTFRNGGKKSKKGKTQKKRRVRSKK